MCYLSQSSYVIDFSEVQYVSGNELVSLDLSSSSRNELVSLDPPSFGTNEASSQIKLLVVVVLSPQVAAPSKRGPSAFILASLIETELNLPLREDLTCFL